MNQIIKLDNFSNIFEIPLTNINPNFSFTSTLSNQSFYFNFRTIEDKLYFSISKDDIYLFNNMGIKYNIALNYTSIYYFDKGYFFFYSSVPNIEPTYENLGKYIKLYYGEF